MVDSSSHDLLQPALLDRLTDHEPNKQAESRDHRVLSMRQLKAALLRDLNWLLNTGSMEATEDLSEYPEVAASVINFGVRDQTGMATSSLKTRDLEKQIKEAIARFEPRIVPHTLRVKAVVTDEQSSHNAVFFEIYADMWANPIPEHLFLQTKIDLETGSIELDSAPPRGNG